jgi:long-chain fatty acid transport protein
LRKEKSEMKRKTKQKIITLFLALSIISGIALANGLNLNGLGTRAVSMGGAFIGLADDFSLVYWNPAGAGFLKKPLYGAYLTDLIPTNRYSLVIPPNLSLEAKTRLSHYLGFLTAYYRPLSDNLVVGLGIYTPAGLGANWRGEDFKPLTGGVAYDWTSKVGLFTISPLLGWKLNEWISLGATFNLNYGMFSLKRWAGEAEINDSMVDLGQYDESLHGWGWGLTLGLLARPADWFSFGLTVKTSNRVKFKGQAEMVLLGYAGYPDHSDLRRNLKWPWFIGGGVALRPVAGMVLTADVHWTGWSAIKTLETTYLDPIWSQMMAESGADRILMDWSSRFQVRFGFEYQLNPEWRVRAGYYYDPSPAPDYTLNVLLPSFNFKGLSAGFGYELNGLSVNWGLEFLSSKKRQVTVEELIIAGTLGQAMPGTYKMRLLVPSLSVSYRF